MNHAQANQILRDEWIKVWGRPGTDAEILFMQAVAWLETNYGRAGQFSSWPAEGDYNWADLEKAVNPDGSCPAGWRSGVDVITEAGIKTTNARCFRVFPSDNEAANALIKNLTKRHWPTVTAIAAEGTAEAMAHAMKATPAYYEANESVYAAGLKNVIKTIGTAAFGPNNAAVARALSAPGPLPHPVIVPSKPSSGLWWQLPTLAAAAYGAYRFARRIRR